MWDFKNIFKHCEPVFYGSPEIEGGKKSEEERHGADTNHEPEEDLNGVQRLASNSPSKKSQSTTQSLTSISSLLNRKIIDVDKRSSKQEEPHLAYLDFWPLLWPSKWTVIKG